MRPAKHDLGIRNDGEPMELYEDFQPQAIERMIELGRCLLHMSMGLGKTVCALKYIEAIQPPELFIVASRKATYGWLRMMHRWYPTFLKQFTVILDKHQGVRKEKWARHPRYVITTWNILQRDKLFVKKWGYFMLIADEVHKVMRSHKTQSRKLLVRMQSIYMCMLSGSPIAGRHGGEWWTYINLLSPARFSSYWKFVFTFANVQEGYFGKEVFGVKNVEALQKVLRDHVVVVLKGDIGRKRKIRGFIETEMTPAQRRAYEELRDNMYTIIEQTDTTSTSIVSTTVLTNIVRLRQLLACPAMLDASLGPGGAVEDLCELLKELPREERHTVIFTPFRNGLPQIRDALLLFGVVDDGRDIQLFLGGMTTDDLHERLGEWRERKGIGICTIQYAESFDMETCDKGFFIGYEWDPDVNYQAEDRIDRIINKFPILNMHYFRYVGTVDDDVMANIVEKAQNMNFMLKDPKRLSWLLRKRGTVEEELVGDV